MDEIRMLHELCGALFEQLKPVKEKIVKGGMSTGDLEAVDKMTHAIKSIKTITAMTEAEDEGYSEAYMPRISYEGRSNRGGRSYEGRSYEGRSYNDGRSNNSYARGNQRRDSMGRYSGYSYDTEELRDMLHELPEHERKKLLEEMR